MIIVNSNKLAEGWNQQKRDIFERDAVSFRDYPYELVPSGGYAELVERVQRLEKIVAELTQRIEDLEA